LGEKIQTQTASRSPDINHWSLMVDLGSTDEIYGDGPWRRWRTFRNAA